MSQVFAPAVEGLILLAVVYAIGYLAAGYVMAWLGKTVWRMWRK